MSENSYYCNNVYIYPAPWTPFNKVCVDITGVKSGDGITKNNTDQPQQVIPKQFKSHVVSVLSELDRCIGVMENVVDGELELTLDKMKKVRGDIASIVFSLNENNHS